MKTTSVGLALLAALLWPGVAMGQPAARGEPQPLEEYVTLTGRQIPYYYLVRPFFEGAVARYQLADQVFFDQFLKRLGFEPGSPAVQAFEASLEAYSNLIPSEQEKQDVHDELIALVDDEPAYWARQGAWEREQAEALGDLYRVLAETLEEVGSSMDGIELYIYHRIAPVTKLMSDKPLGARSYATTQAFEARAGLLRENE